MLKSKYNPEGSIISEAQYLAEIMVERKAKRTLPIQFWNLDAYKRDYQLQIIHANSLLKIYPFAVIIAALKQLKWCWSLKTKALENILVRLNVEKDQKAQITQETNNKDTVKELKTRTQTQRNKLQHLDIGD